MNTLQLGTYMSENPMIFLGISIVGIIAGIIGIIKPHIFIDGKRKSAIVLLVCGLLGIVVTIITI